MKIYHYHPTYKAFLGEGQADRDPQDPDNFLLPAHSTLIEPPVAGEDQIAAWDGDAWGLVEDHRRKTIYLIGEPHDTGVVVKFLGPIPETFSFEKTPHEPDPLAEIEAQREVIREELRGQQDQMQNVISTLQAGDATSQQVQRGLAWVLKRLTQTEPL